MTFDEAVDDAVAWIENVQEVDGAPALVALGDVEAGSGLAVSPWRIDTPRAKRGAEGVVLSATVRCCVWVRGDDPKSAAKTIDAVFFAAMQDDVWRISDMEPPASVWGASAPPLSVTIAREIERETEDLRPGRVEIPPIIDIAPRVDRAIPERT